MSNNQMLPHKLDLGKNNFRRFINNLESLQTHIPFVHSTDAYSLKDILENKSIDPQSCGIFTGEELIYLFFGRPAFRPNLQEESASLAHYAPVCLILKKDFRISTRRAFPFDSGAFQKNLYGSFMHKKMKLGDFSLDFDSGIPGKVVNFFFGSVERYMIGKAKAEIEIDSSEFEVYSYHALLNFRESNEIDSRSSAIEFQTSSKIMVEEAVAAVVLPQSFVDGSIGDILNNAGIEVLPYRGYDRLRPVEYMSKIHDLCISYYEQKKYIEKGRI